MNAAVWAWIGLVLGIVAFVAGFDWWANATNHATMSGQFHTWMTGQVSGPVAVALWSAVSGGLIYHFLINK